MEEAEAEAKDTKAVAAAKSEKPAKPVKSAKSAKPKEQTETAAAVEVVQVKKSSKEYKELSKIENQLIQIFAEEQKIWVRTYLLMQKVRETGLYTAKGHKSFSAWMNSLASEIIHVHVSLLWKRLKAGDLYAQHVERLEASSGASSAAGPQDTAQKIADGIQQTEVSPDTLVLIDKVADGNSAQVDELIEKAERGELKNKDLKDAWAVAKVRKLEAGQAPTRKSKHQKKADVPDSAAPADAGAADGEAGGAVTAVSAEELAKAQAEKQAQEDAIAAAQVIHALDDSGWLRKLYNYDADPRKFDKPTFKLLREFPISTPTAAHARRIDALVVENFSIDPHVQDAVALHGIEVKVSESDLKRDTKMADYALYVDKFWIAVPDKKELLDAARGYLGEGWGLIAIQKDVGEDGLSHFSVRVEKQAEQGKPQFKERALMTLARKLIN